MYSKSFDAFDTGDLFRKGLTCRDDPGTRKHKNKFASSVESCWQLELGEFLNT